MAIVVSCDVPKCKIARRMDDTQTAKGWAKVEFSFDENYWLCPEHAMSLGVRKTDKPKPIDPAILALLNDEKLEDDN